MQINSKALLDLFSPKKIAIPIILGLGVASFFVIRNFDREAYLALDWGGSTAFWLIVSMSMMVVRDLAFMYRIRILTNKHLTWRRSFDVIMIWEFASSVTPSVVGGTAAAFFVLAQEGIKAGRSTAVVLVTAFLDELFFITFAPLMILLVGVENAFPLIDEQLAQELFFGRSIVIIFLVGYAILFLYTLLLVYGIFFHPRGLKWLIIRFFSIRWLQKWKYSAIQLGDEVIVASKEFRQKNWLFWVKTFGATIASWSARYLMLNFLILAFFPVDSHLIVYARQLIMWVILLIPVSPGGSGVAEIIFPLFFSPYTSEALAPSVAFFWRLLSYYPYLFIGAIVLPQWIRRVFRKEDEELQEKD